MNCDAANNGTWNWIKKAARKIRNLGTDGTYPSFESKMGNALMIPNQN